jgi:hypothetical protein
MIFTSVWLTWKPDKKMYTPREGTDKTDKSPAPLSEALHEFWEERAAIMEYDGGLSRAEAERLAADCLGQQTRAREG